MNSPLLAEPVLSASKEEGPGDALCRAHSRACSRMAAAQGEGRALLEKIRVGVVGTSWWADEMHLPSLKSHPRAEVVAICGRDATRANAMAAKYAIAQVFSDYRAMIERANLHALIVSVPDDLHYAVTMAALEAGLHVVCEKPLALNATQARAMYELAEAKRVKHLTYFTWR